MTNRADTDPWWRTAVVYQVYPRSFADSDGDGVGDLPGITGRLDHLARARRRRAVAVAGLPLPAGRQRLRHQRLPGRRPAVRHARRPRRADRRLHDRGIRLVMDLVVNHTSDEHPWFVESRARRRPKRDWYWWRPARAGTTPATRRRADQLGVVLLRPRLGVRRGAAASTTCTCSSRKQPDLNWENPEVRQAVHAMMRWWLDRGRRRLPDGRHQLDLQGPRAARRPRCRPAAHARRSTRPVRLNGPRIHEFLAEMHREVFAGPTGTCSPSARCPA